MYHTVRRLSKHTCPCAAAASLPRERVGSLGRPGTGVKRKSYKGKNKKERGVARGVKTGRPGSPGGYVGSIPAAVPPLPLSGYSSNFTLLPLLFSSHLFTVAAGFRPAAGHRKLKLAATTRQTNID